MSYHEPDHAELVLARAAVEGLEDLGADRVLDDAELDVVLAMKTQ